MKIIAHRSGPAVYPEQTILSALAAMREKADYIEIDTRFCKDGTVVITHDENVSRVYGVDRSCHDMTETEFLSLRHKNAPAYPSHRLCDYMKAGVAPLLLHVKEAGEKLDALLALIREYGYEDKVVLGLETAADVRHAKEVSQIPVLGFLPHNEEAEAFAEAGCDFIRLWEADVTEKNVARVFGTGKKLWIMSGACTEEGVGITDRKNLVKWKEMGVDAVLINDVRDTEQYK